MLRMMLFVTVLAFAATPAGKAESLLLCGAETVFEIDTATAENGTISKTWVWDARECHELPDALRGTFKTTDDCKSVDGGARVLICSSSGGCALVERPAGKVLWYAQVPNAHSLEFLPRERIVVASSVSENGNRLVLFDVARSNQPLGDTPLPSAHGVVWDAGRQLLWALGLDELRCYELRDWHSEQPSLAMKASYPLPDADGHDLQPIPGSDDLAVTTGRHVYLFSRDKRAFRPHPGLADQEQVKSMSVDPGTGRTAFVQATESWWSDRLGLLSPAGRIQLPGERLYKARWLSQDSGKGDKGDAGSSADTTLLFRFVQLNDLHVQASEPAVTASQQTYAQANEKARWVVAAIKDRTLGPRPDFVVGVGDLIHGESIDRLAPDLEALREIIAPIPCPFYPVVGNHEVVQQERSPEYARPWCEAFGRESTDYTFSYRGILFVAVNNAGAPNAEAAAQRNAWLRGVLAAAGGQPTIVLCHIPLVPLRDESILAESFGFTSYRDHDPGTLEAVAEHRDTVIAVLSGHLHLTGMKQQDGICHISIAGTASYPCDVAAYDVFPDRIEVAVQQLPEGLATSAASIHGQQRHGRDFVDADHDTPEQYQSGRASERCFTISLTGSKRPLVAD